MRLKPWRQNNIINRLADRGMDVTVCVGAIADIGDSIVAISDSMLSIDQRGGFSMTADNNIWMKGGGIHTDWIALYSGSVSLPVPIILETRAALAGGPRSLLEVADAFRSSYIRHLARHVADEVLAPGFDVESFYEDGLEKLGEMGFTEKRRDFEYRMQSDPALEFLVFGFDGSGRAHIFTVSNPGVITYHDNEGFWAIGSGQQIAITALMFHQYNQLCPMPWSIYHVCEAKFMAEKAPGVGKESFVIVMNQKSGFRWYPASHVAAIRDVWEKFGRPSRPAQAVNLIEAVIKQHKELLEKGANYLGVMPSTSQTSESKP
jgi:hypothetical protein